MKPISTTAGQRQQRLAMSMLPADHFARAGGAELSLAERLLVEDFRQMDADTRATMVTLFQKQACRDREARMVENRAGLRLVGGGA